MRHSSLSAAWRARAMPAAAAVPATPYASPSPLPTPAADERRGCDILRIAPAAAALPLLRRPQRRCMSASAAPVLSPVDVVTVDRDNFVTSKASLADALKSAAFVALDCEFTGLAREKQQGRSTLRSADERYLDLRRTLRGRLMHGEDKDGNRRQGYLVVQVGLSCFRWDAKAQKYDVQSYSFYVSPRPMSKTTGNVKVEHDLHFGCLASALTFLSNHGFDFNRWLNQGVPFMSRAAYNAEKERIGRGAHMDLPGELEDARGFLEVWEQVVQSGKPLVGHQCLLDVLYLWQQLEGPLPKSLSQFLEALESRLQHMVDTKHILAAYPEDLLKAAETQLVRVRTQRISESSDPLLSAQERTCRDVVSLLNKGGGLKSLQLLEVYSLLEPLVRSQIPRLRGDINAHDAGADSYMTGVVYAALHSLIHRAQHPPTAEFLQRHHVDRGGGKSSGDRGSGADAPAVAPVPLDVGDPKAFSYANKLHVFASPFSINTAAPVAPMEDTHATTVVVTPPAGGIIDNSRITQLLATTNPYSEIFWIDFQRIAVVKLHTRAGDVRKAADVVAAFSKALEPYRWVATSAIEYTNRGRLEAAEAEQRPASPPSPSPQKKRRALSSRQRRWLRRVRRSAADAKTAAVDTRQQMLEARQQAAQRLQELMEAQKELTKLRDVEKTLKESQKVWETTTETLSALESRQAEWQENNETMSSDKEALVRQVGSLNKGLLTQRQQTEVLRAQLAESQKKYEKAANAAQDERMKTQLLEVELADARAKAQAARQEALRSKAAAKESAAARTSPVDKIKQRRATPSPAAAAASGGADAGADAGGEGAAAQAGAVAEAGAGGGGAAAPAAGAAVGASGKATKAMAGAAGVGAPPQKDGSSQLHAEETRPGHWIVQHAKGNTAVVLHVEKERQQVLEVKDCKNMKLFVDGTLSAVTLTGCENVQLYCETFVSEPGKSWSWGEQRMSGPKIFYYASDKASIKMYQLPSDQWPSVHKSATAFTSKRVVRQHSETERRKMNAVNETIRLVSTMALLLVLIQVLFRLRSLSDPELHAEYQAQMAREQTAQAPREQAATPPLPPPPFHAPPAGAKI